MDCIECPFCKDQGNCYYCLKYNGKIKKEYVGEKKEIDWRFL